MARHYLVRLAVNGSYSEVDGVVAEFLVDGVGDLHEFAVALVFGFGEEVELHAFFLGSYGTGTFCYCRYDRYFGHTVRTLRQ